MDEGQLRVMVKETLKPLGMYSEEVEELLMMTMAAESHLGEYLEQVGGPASGLYQMEPKTAQDIHNNYLHYREETANKVYSFMTMMGTDLKYNLQYQTIMARLHYMRVPKEIPPKEDVEGLAEYYKTYWNTYKGKATVDGAIEKYNYYVGE